MITPGQIYYSVHPLDDIRIRVVAAPVGGFGSYQSGKAEVETLLPDGRAVRRRRMEAGQLHASPLTKTGAQRRTGYVLEATRGVMFFAWCFSHGVLHRFTPGQDPWCTASWVWLEGGSETEALADKATRFGEARFLDGLPQEQQLAIIDGEIAGQRTEEKH